MTQCKLFKYMRPKFHTHLKEEFRYFYVSKDKDTRNSPQDCRHSVSRGLQVQGGSHGAGPRDDLIGASLIQALGCLQARLNFHEIASTTNDRFHFHHYPSLLGPLAEWHIDLTIADVGGLTALHFAYMKGDPDIVCILRRGGAPERDG